MNGVVFQLPRLERVISGPGSVESIAAEFDRYRATRIVIVTGRTLAASPLVSRIASELGERCVSVFGGARQHVPSGSVDALLAEMSAHRADGLLSVGGGSPIDTAKAALHVRLDSPEPLVHIAVPTTLSAGEFTDVAGITDEATRIKRAVFDVRLAPRTVIADPEATLDTPEWLWKASGIRALDHAIETLYAARRHPISEPLSVRGIQTLVEHLPGSTIRDRGECQLAAWQAVFGITNAGFGLSHVLGHQIGPRWDVPHGVTSAIMLPHAMHFMADAAPDRFAPIARGLGIPFDVTDPRRAAHACADRVAAFIAQFNLPARLRDAGVPRNEIGDIAAHVTDVLRDAYIVERPITARDLTNLLESAY